MVHGKWYMVHTYSGQINLLKILNLFLLPIVIKISKLKAKDWIVLKLQIY